MQLGTLFYNILIETDDLSFHIKFSYSVSNPLSGRKISPEITF